MKDVDLKHFLLPSEPGRENVQIAFSGGRTSAMMLFHILEANGGLPDRAVATFQNTGREMPQTLDFVQECGDRWNVPIVWLEYDTREATLFREVNHNSASRNGEPFKMLIEKKKFLPNAVTRFCTTEMKIRTVKRYLVRRGWKHWWNGVGYRADEAHRLKPIQARERWKQWYPLHAACISKRDVMAFWEKQPFDLNLPTVDGNCWLGNCDGCFLKSEASLFALARDLPKRHQWWEDMETLVTEISGDQPPGSKFANGAKFRMEYSRRSLSRLVEEQGDFFSENPGLLCQADEGECFG